MDRALAIQEFLKASTLMEQRQYDDALEIFYSIQPVLSEVSALYYNIAQILAKKEEWGSALEQVEVAIDIETKIKYLILQFKILQQLGRFDVALNVGEEILELETNPKVATNVAYLHLRHHDFEKAMDILSDLHELQSLSPTAMFTLGILNYQSKQYDSAEKYIKEAIDRGYDSLEATEVLLSVFEKSGRLNEGISHLEDMDNNSPMIKFSLARLYKDNNQLDESLILISDLIGKERKIEYLIFYAHLLRELGKFEEAIPLYDEVLGRKPEHLGAIKGKALALVELDRHEEANVLFEKGERINRGGELPDFSTMVKDLDVLK